MGVGGVVVLGEGRFREMEREVVRRWGYYYRWRGRVVEREGCGV